MATSSIFHNFVIDDPKTAERFVNALEESAKTPRRKRSVNYELVTDPDKIQALMDRWKQKHNRDK